MVVSEIFANFDANQNGFLNREEFVASRHDAFDKGGFEDYVAWARQLQAVRVRAMFDTADTSKNGGLVSSELVTLLRSKLSAGTDFESIANTILDNNDFNKDNSLSFNEFVTFIDSLAKGGDGLPDFKSITSVLSPEEQLARADTNKDGRVTFEEAFAFLRSKDSTIKDKDLESVTSLVFSDFDDDRNRTLNRDEFKAMLFDAANNRGFQDLKAWANQLRGADEYQAMFDSADRNQNGILASSELEAFLTSVLPKGTDSETIQTINNDILKTKALTESSSLTFDEFVTFIEALPEDKDGLPDFESLISELSPDEDFANADKDEDGKVSFGEAYDWLRTKDPTIKDKDLEFVTNQIFADFDDDRNWYLSKDEFFAFHSDATEN